MLATAYVIERVDGMDASAVIEASGSEGHRALAAIWCGFTVALPFCHADFWPRKLRKVEQTLRAELQDPYAAAAIASTGAQLLGEAFGAWGTETSSERSANLGELASWVCPTDYAPARERVDRLQSALALDLAPDSFERDRRLAAYTYLAFALEDMPDLQGAALSHLHSLDPEIFFKFDISVAYYWSYIAPVWANAIADEPESLAFAIDDANSKEAQDSDA
jgi:hypothetical protein